MFFALASLLLIESISSACAESVAIPRFRAGDAAAQKPEAVTLPEIRLLAETDYAPWSFMGDDGKLQGISADLAMAACTEAGLTCMLVPTPYTALVPTLQKGEGDMIVTGLRLTPNLVSTMQLTRPYFRAMGRFMIRDGTPIATPDPRSLAGKRMGVVAGTQHEAFIKGNYPKVQIVSVDGEATLFEQLRTGALDVAFGDSLHMSFWMNSDAARKCCAALGGAMLDQSTFSRPLVFVLRKDRGAVRDRLDQALDRLEEKGTTAAIFARYLPAPIW
ncbi:MAG: transporter substrate-binding domain-containing protein [Hyphomicrobiales bacterium]